MSIFATMDMKWINRIDRYVVALGVISLVVAFLTHFPELISLFDRSGQNDLSGDALGGCGERDIIYLYRLAAALRIEYGLVQVRLVYGVYHLVEIALVLRPDLDRQ